MCVLGTGKGLTWGMRLGVIKRTLRHYKLLMRVLWLSPERSPVRWGCREEGEGGCWWAAGPSGAWQSPRPLEALPAPRLRCLAAAAGSLAKPVPLSARGRGLFLLALAGPVSRAKHLYFLLIKLSPGDTSVPARLAAFIRGEDGAVLWSAGAYAKHSSQAGLLGYQRQRVKRWPAGICI